MCNDQSECSTSQHESLNSKEMEHSEYDRERKFGRFLKTGISADGKFLSL